MGRSKVRVAGCLTHRVDGSSWSRRTGFPCGCIWGRGVLGTTQSKVERPALPSSPPLLTPNSLPTGGGSRREGGGGATGSFLKRHVSVSLKDTAALSCSSGRPPASPAPTWTAWRSGRRGRRSEGTQEDRRISTLVSSHHVIAHFTSIFFKLLGLCFQ